jgi:phage-related tail fiber protein
MSYYMIPTVVGAAKIAAATAGGPKVNLANIAVGDNNGNPLAAPDVNATALVREVYRHQINALSISPADSTVMMAEMLIDSTIGPFSIMEIGIFDDHGALIFYGNFPATYKPISTDGSTRDMIISAAVKVGSASNINLIIDTTVVGATRAWVLSTITAAFLIPGGTTDQLLAKNSNAAGDFKWVSPGATFNFVFNVNKEVQTSASGQSVFTLATITTQNTAMYIDGIRQVDFTILNSTQLQLPSPISAGHECAFYQNEPTEPINIRRLISGRAYYYANAGLK